MKENNNPVVIGYSCRFPGANNSVGYWHNILDGVCSIRKVSAASINLNDYDHQNVYKEISLGLLDNAKAFDNDFFNISNRDAKFIDPQQRLALEEVWHAIEDASLPLDLLQKKLTSVYVGSMTQDYYEYILKNSNDIDHMTCLGNYSCSIANRISYHLGFTGESLTIATACSSSLVAVHKACESIQNGTCDYAIVVGVNVICNGAKYIAFDKSHMLSDTGENRTFDENASGYIPGEGIGVVILTNVNNALVSRYTIKGVITGTAVNHNGHTRGMTVPDVDAQVNLIQHALSQNQTRQNSIGYIEAHGTGTSLGDPIEVTALKRVFSSDRKNPVFVGSVKPGIGHLEAAAGIAGLIKVLLMLEHKKIPPQVNIKHINPLLEIENSNLEIPLLAMDWECGKEKEQRVAGVSSFGFGGVNAHVLVSEYISCDQAGHKVTDSPLPFLLSANSLESLNKLKDDWYDIAIIHEDWRQLCVYSMFNQSALKYRIGCIVDQKEALQEGLKSLKHAATKADNIEPLILKLCELKFPQLNCLTGCQQKFPQFYGFCHSELKRYGFVDLGFLDQPWVNYLFSYYILNIAYKALKANFMSFKLSGWFELAALEYFGYLSATDVAKIIQAYKVGKIEQVNLKSGQMPIFSASVKDKISCCIWDKGLLDRLLNTIEDGTYKKIDVNQFRRLYGAQRTYRNGVNSYLTILNRYGFNISTTYDVFEILISGSITKQQKFVLCFVLGLAYMQLIEKWNLTQNVLEHFPWQLTKLICSSYQDSYLTEELFKYFSDVECIFHHNERYISKARLDKTFFDQPGLCDITYEFDETAKINDNDFLWEKEVVYEFTHEQDEINEATCVASYLSKNILNIWLQGWDVDWKAVYPSLSPITLKTPLYPFDRKNIWWYKGNENNDNKKISVEKKFNFNKIYLDQNRVRKLSKGHVIDGQCIVPGALIVHFFFKYAEANQNVEYNLSNVTFSKPLVLSENNSLFIELLEKNGVLSANLLDDEVIYSTCHYDDKVKKDRQLIEFSLDNPKKIMDEAEIYATFSKINFSYAHKYRALSKIHLNDNYAVGFMKPGLFQTDDDYCYALDLAFQVSYFLKPGEIEKSFPYFISTIELVTTEKPNVVVVRDTVEGFTCQVFDQQMKVCLNLTGLKKRDTEQDKYSVLSPYWRIIKASQKEMLSNMGVVYVNEKLEYLDKIKRLAVKNEICIYKFEEDINVFLNDDERPGVLLILIPVLEDAEINNHLDISHFAIILFKLFKQLTEAYSRSQQLHVMLLVNSAFNITNRDKQFPLLATFPGFVKSLQKEYPNWTISLCDFPNFESDNINYSMELAVQLVDKACKGGCYAIRQRKIYQRIWRLRDKNLFKKNMMPLIEPNTTVLIVGGSGGIGKALSLYLAKVAKIKLIVIGRSKRSEKIEQLIREVDLLGSELVYCSCDARDADALCLLLNNLEKHHGQIDYLFYLALKLNDSLFTKMSEGAFLESLESKTACVNILHAIQYRPQYIVFFSSYLAYQANAGQCNYLAGCTFQDEYAKWLQATLGVPTLTINWGFWGNIGAVASEFYRKKFLDKGIVSIEQQAGFDYLRHLMDWKGQHLIIRHNCSLSKILPDLVINFTGEDHLEAFNIENQVIVNEITYSALNSIQTLFSENKMCTYLSSINLENMMRKIAVLPKFEDYLLNLLNHMEKAGFIVRKNGSFRFQNIQQHAETILSLSELESKHPEYMGYIALLKSVLENFLAIIQGKVLATDVMFARNKVQLLDGFYKNCPQAEKSNQLLRAMIEKIITNSELSGIKILEIGAGTGASSEYIIPVAMDSQQVLEYYYTDVSQSFLNIGAKKVYI